MAIPRNKSTEPTVVEPFPPTAQYMQEPPVPLDVTPVEPESEDAGSTDSTDE